MSNLLLVFLGGGLGSLVRFGLSVWLLPWSERFPLGTLTANVLASLLAGYLLGWASIHHDQGPLRAFGLIGFCGGFSTFSTFSLETFEMLQAGEWGMALLYAVSSILACLIGVAAGISISRM